MPRLHFPVLNLSVPCLNFPPPLSMTLINDRNILDRKMASHKCLAFIFLSPIFLSPASTFLLPSR